MTAPAINKKAISSGKTTQAHQTDASTAVSSLGVANIDSPIADELTIDLSVLEIKEPGPIEQLLDKKLSAHQLPGVKLTDTPVFSDVIKAYAS